jgi:RNA polymerase sigma-70 factor (ECF subfamily)
MVSTTPRERSDDELVAASMTVPEDFGAIFERHYAVVAAYCRRRTGAQVGAEIVAETFARAFEHRARYRGGGSGARPWLLGIATHVIGDHRRAQMRQLRAYANQSTAPPDESARSDDRLDMQAMGPDGLRCDPWAAACAARRAVAARLGRPDAGRDRRGARHGARHGALAFASGAGTSA